MKLIVSALLLSMVVGGAATAGPKAKTPPPPVPKYWLGEFVLDDDAVPEAKTVQHGFVTVRATDAPEKGIVVQPIDPKFEARPAIGLADAGDPYRIYSTKSYTPAFEDNPKELPMVLVVDEAANPKPVVIKSSKVVKALRKRLAKDYPVMAREAKTWALGIADLDADGLGDVALFYGCHEWDGGCSGTETMVYERDGAGWKEIKLHTDDQ